MQSNANREACFFAVFFLIVPAFFILVGNRSLFAFRCFLVGILHSNWFLMGLRMKFFLFIPHFYISLIQEKIGNLDR